MYSSPVVGGGGAVLGATTGAVLANTGSPTIVVVAVGVAIAMVTWALALVKTN